MNNMRATSKCLGLTVMALVACTQVQAGELTKPNVVFILADDMGWKDLGCYGSTFYETPNIDKLAESGVRFTDAYAAAPLCSATRAAILTGWSPARQHLIGVTPPSREQYDGFKDYLSWRDAPEYRYNKMPLALSKQLGQLHPDRSITIAERLKESGYATAFIGKWHLGPDADKYPEKHGFDINIGGSHFGFPRSYFSPYGIPNLTDGTDGEYLTDRLTDEALSWMEAQHRQKKPFFLYLSHFAVHGPWQSKDEYTEYFQSNGHANDQQPNAVYAGMIKSLDDSVGRLMDQLRTLGIEQNTLVIFTSDNGGIIRKNDKKTGEPGPVITSMHPLRGEKALLYEGGVRVPCIIRMPGTVQEGAISHAPINSVDFYPTILEIAGLAKTEGNPLDGQSLMRHVTTGAPLKREFLTWFMPAWIKAGGGMDPCATIRYGNHKHIKFFDGRKELYDLSRDIGEKQNIAEAYPELCETLDAMLMNDLQSKNAHIPVKQAAGSAAESLPKHGGVTNAHTMAIAICPRLVPGIEGGNEEAFVRRVEDLFINKPDQWRYVSDNISHFKFYSTPLTWMSKKHPELLRRVVESITDMGKGIAVEVGIRHGHAQTERAILDPITEAGGRVDFIITDNVFIKSQHSRKDEYGWTYEETVNRYADYVAGIKRKYPRLKVGLLEAAFRFHWEDKNRFPAEIPAKDQGDLKALLMDVIKACEARGTRIDIFQPEYSYERIVNTENGWEKLKAMEAFCRDEGIEFYFLFNDHTGGHHSDELFHANVMKCLRAVKSHGLTPKLGTIQSWYEHPVRDLPEEEPHTFMYLAKEFIRENARKGVK